MGTWTYLALELIWAVPVIVIQWMIAGAVLRSHWRVLAAAIALPTLYLSTADALAIRVGIWSLNPERTLGVWIGALPLEEGLFFLLTNVMVAQGILMLLGSERVPWRRPSRREMPAHPAIERGRSDPLTR